MRLLDEEDVIKVIQGLKLRTAQQTIRAIGAINKIPTAFDVEEVVKQLESIKEKGVCYVEECKHCKYLSRCWDGEEADNLALDKAIEIVKRGGRDE